MNIYDKNQNTLSEYIKEYLEDAYYLRVQRELKQIINQNPDVLNKNQIKYINEIIEYIKSPHLLLNTSSDVRSSFIWVSTTPDHKIFDIEPNLKYINNIIQLLHLSTNNQNDSKIQNGFKNNILKTIINTIQQCIDKDYSVAHKSFINKLVEFVKKNQTTRSVEPPPSLYTEDLKYYEIKSLDLAYQLTSYHFEEHQFKRKNESQKGLSVGSVMDNKVYFKVDTGDSKLLKPAKEHAVYQFYKNLFPKLALVSPTQILIVDRFKILPQEFRRELGQVMTKHNERNIEKVLRFEPELRKKVEGALNNNQQIFVQASLFTDGIGFDKYLERCEEKNDQSYSDINMESYSSHIISSLLLMPTDFKPDNLMLENGTNNIIGIDNDEALEFDEVKITSDDYDSIVGVKNILYTLKPLMLQPVHPKVREQFLLRNPALFIIKWLMALEEKNSNYNSMIKLLLETNGFDCTSESKKMTNKREGINLPLQFKSGWISSMFKRFKSIKALLISNPNITHQELFNQIHPLASIHYQILSVIHPNSPLDMISTIYNRPQEILKCADPSLQVTYQLLLKNTILPTTELDHSIKDTIKELVLEIDFKDLLECKVLDNESKECGANCSIMCKSRTIVIEALTLLSTCFRSKDISISHESMVEKKDSIYSKLLRYGISTSFKCNEAIGFNGSWSENKIDILSKLLRYGAQKDIIELIVDNLKVQIDNSQFQEMVRQKEVFRNPNICNQIESLIDRFSLDIEKSENNTTLLDLASEYHNLDLFIKLVEMGAGKFSNGSVISKFYQKLFDDQKLKLKPYLVKLFIINPKITWKIALEQLFPLQSESNRGNPNRLLSEITNTTKRIISDEYWDQLFDGNEIIKSNEYGSRAVTLIQDKFGCGIYIKLKPQFPGTEFAVGKLCDLIFGRYDLTPNTELASINDIPVLLIQQIPGDTLVDVLYDSPNNIIHIDPLNMSKQLIMSVLINNADGNLGNFIVVNNKSYNIGKPKFKLYSIDLDQSFMPSVASKGSKASLQVDTVLFLFNQMNDRVHQDVIDRIESLNVYEVLKEWLESLKYHHQSSLDHFESCREKLKKDKETIIGVSFNEGMISQIYSKLKRLQQLLKKAKASQTTHLEVLETLEPLIANRYRKFLAMDISIVERYNKLKSLNDSTRELVSCSKHPSTQVLLSRDIPNVKDIIDVLWSGEYGPKQALQELQSSNNRFKDLKSLLSAINDKASRSSIKLLKYDLECLLKTDLINIPTENQAILFNLIKHYQLSEVTLRNCDSFQTFHLDSFKLDSIVKLELTKCHLYLFMGNITRLQFSSMVRITINECDALGRVNISAPNLKAISVTNCRDLRRFSCKAPELRYLNLAGSINRGKSTFLARVPTKITKYKKLEYLNLSGSDFNVLFIKSNIKSLDISSMKYLKTLRLEVSAIESINFEGCIQLNEIMGFDDYCLNLNLWRILNHQRNKSIIQQNKIIINLRQYRFTTLALNGQISGLSIIVNGDQFVPLSFFKYHHVLPLPNNINLNSLKGGLQSNLSFMSLCDEFDQDLDTDFFPLILFALYLGNIKRPIKSESLPKRLKLLYLGNGYSFNLSDILHQPVASGIETLFLENISQPLVSNSIPANIKHLVLCDGYQHRVTADIIPPTLNKISIISRKDISLPTSLYFIDFQNDSYCPDIIKPFKVKDLVIGSLLYPVEINGFDSLSPKVIIRYMGQSRINHSELKQINNLKIEDLKELFMIKSVGRDCKAVEFWDSPPLSSTSVLNDLPSNIENLYIGFIEFIMPLELIPPNIVKLELTSKFNQALLPNQLPATVKELVLDDIAKTLEVGSLSKVNILTLLDGFSQTLKPGIIGDSVKELYMCQLKQQLKPNIIPASVTKLRVSVLDYQLSPGVIPDSVTNLHITVSSKTLATSSLPSNIKVLVIVTNEPIVLNKPGLIPYGVVNLYIINQCKDPIQISEFGTIPTTVKVLELRGYFLHIPPQLLPHSITDLYLETIKQPLVVGSIPATVNSLELGTGFAHSLSPGIIPSLITELYVGDIQLPIFKVNSIPWSLQSLSLYVGYSHLLDFDKIIPRSVTDLYVGYVPQQLNITIPSHIERLGYGYAPPPFNCESSSINQVCNIYKRRENSYNHLNYYYS